MISHEVLGVFHLRRHSDDDEIPRGLRLHSDLVISEYDFRVVLCHDNFVSGIQLLDFSSNDTLLPGYRHLLAMREELNSKDSKLPVRTKAVWQNLYLPAPKTLFEGSSRRRFVSYLFLNKIWSIGFHAIEVPFCPKFRLIRIIQAGEDSA